MADIEAIKKEYNDLLEQLSNSELISDWEKFEELSKRKNLLEKMIEKINEIEESKNQIEENKEILKGQEDKELSSMADAEIINLQERIKNIEEELETIAKNEEKPNKEEAAAAIIEIRAGTGGDEAALFASDLFNMYSKYAESQGWKSNVLDSHPTGIGGIKEIVFELNNNNAFSKMKYEGGVHRVQRIPTTEKNGRVHTSTASVAVLPKPKSSQITIRPDEIKIDFFRSSGPGGQNVNKRETAVRLTHLPTGIVVASQTERNQLKNKDNAMRILKAKILERKLIAEEEKTGGNRNAQIGWAKRAEKIRTYNFPQDRLTDHRVKKSWHNLEKIMEGDLDPVILVLRELDSA